MSYLNVSIASSVTVYARIKMSYFKFKYSDILYTDCLDLDLKILDKGISNNLG